MKIVSGLKLYLGALLVGAAAGTPNPLSNVQVTLKGKKYQIDDVSTVSELQECLEEQSGIAPSKQGKILHNGKRLSTGSGADSLSEAGVAEGDQLNCVPSKKSSSSSSMKKKSSAPKATAASTPAVDAASAGAGASDPMADMMKGMAGAGGLEEMVQKMMSGGMGGGGAGGMPDMAESMKMMKELTDSPMFEEYMNDPEKLEESRQMILNNPMMKSMMSSMPGMSDLLNDKEAWAQTMIAAAGIMKQMDPDDMVKMMEAQGAMGGAGGMPPGMGMGGAGLFDGASVSSALDELSEGED